MKFPITNRDLSEVAEEFERISPGEVVAFRTVDEHGTERMQMVRGTLNKASAYIALPVRGFEDGHSLRRLAGGAQPRPGGPAEIRTRPTHQLPWDVRQHRACRRHRRVQGSHPRIREQSRPRRD